MEQEMRKMRVKMEMMEISEAEAREDLEEEKQKIKTAIAPGRSKLPDKMLGSKSTIPVRLFGL